VTPTARSLVLDLLSTLRRGTMPVGALVEAGELFGIPGNNVRVALARLLAAGHVARDERGRYRLGAKAEAVDRRVRSWRDLNHATRAWGGAWIAVHQGASSRERRRPDGAGRERALRFFGFAALETSLSVRPSNLRASVDELRGDLQALGLPAGDLVFEVAAFDEVTEKRARALWDVKSMRATYRERLAQIAASERRIGALPIERAMVESFLLGRGIIRDVVLDPLLPEAICPTAERDELVAALRRYDRLGRVAWAGFLDRFDVPHIGMPLEGGLGAETRRLAV
jgi:phenylacetic acid degradation operon negative regulatory protein